MDRNHYVYQHVTPDGMYYFGVTKVLNRRWEESRYKQTSLQPYIEKWGWENIRHDILLRELTYEEARITENMLIVTAREDGCCINERRSGFIKKDEKEYHKQWYNENKEDYLEKCKKYVSENKEKRKEYLIKNRDIIREKRRKYYEENREEILEKRRERRRKQHTT